MKSIINKILIATVVMLFAFTAKSQQVGLTLVPQGTMPYTSGTQFWVYANYNYSNITGNIVISVSFDNTKVSFCGSPAFPTVPVASSSMRTQVNLPLVEFSVIPGCNPSVMVNVKF